MASEETLEHNVFMRLFSYHPREGHNPRENFLTEAFAYVLAKDARVQGPLIEMLTGGSVKSARVVRVDTQVLHQDEAFAGRCIPDAVIHGIDSSGEAFQLWLENKWGAPFSKEQISRYHRMIKRLALRDPGQPVHLAFVSHDTSQVRAANLHMQRFRAGGKRTALAWRSLHDTIVSRAKGGTVAAEFASFLDRNGLGAVKKISLEAARAFARRRDRTKPIQEGAYTNEPFKRTLQAMCAAVIAEIEAHGIDVGQDLECHIAWGRVAAMTPDQKISIGFLYDPGDHRTAFLDLEAPLDICVRIIAECRGVANDVIAGRRDAFAPLRKELEKIGFDCNPDDGRWRANRYTVVLGHYRRGMPWDADTGAVQLDELSKIFADAWRVLSKPTYANMIRELPGFS
jgi:hypothetical protein